MQNEKSNLVATVFGSSAPEEGSFLYNEAYLIGHALTKADYIVKTGGYYGTMEACSKGASDAGMPAVGIPLKAFAPKAPNKFCRPEEVDNIFQRLEKLIMGSNLIAVLDGQLGTLTEFFLTWEMLESKQIATPPLLCCVGQAWPSFVSTVMSARSIKDKDRDLLCFYKNAEHFIENLDLVTASILRGTPTTSTFPKGSHVQ